MADSRDRHSTARTLGRSTLALAAFWLLVAALLWAGFQWHDSRQRASLVAYTADSGELVIPRSRDGHFYVAGEVNHQPVRFLVDTGATSVAVTQALASRAQLPEGRPIVLTTASGNAKGRLVRDVPIKVGPLVNNDTAVTVGLHADQDDIALLGQSFLRHFDVRITSDRMVLSPD